MLVIAIKYTYTEVAIEIWYEFLNVAMNDFLFVFTSCEFIQHPLELYPTYITLENGSMLQ